MKKKLKIIFFSFLSFLLLLIIISGEDPAWVECSDENDLYRYVYDGWKVDEVMKNYKGEYPRIYLSKDYRIKALNFGWRCYYLEGRELSLTKK